MGRVRAALALLKDDAWAILKELRYVRDTNTPARLKTVEREAEKKAIETARYVIPIGAFTSMVHTVSGIVLHRLNRMLNAGDVPYEAAMVIGAMVDLVKEVDPMFFEKIGFSTFERDTLPEMRFPTPARPAMRLPPSSIAASATACRAYATGRPAPSASSPTPSARRSGSPRPRCPTKKRSIG